MRLFLTLLLVGLLTHAAAADPFYLRHREVEGRQAGAEVYVPRDRLNLYLELEEIKRISYRDGSVLVDGEPAGSLDGDWVPLVAVVKSMGFQVRPSPELGVIDLVPPAAMVMNRNRPAATPTEDGSKREEYQMASTRMRRILEVLPLYPDAAMNRRVATIGQQVAAASPLGNLEWHFVVVNTDVPNAACVGEGFIFVTKGLLDLGVSDTELAGVLGHEVAHGVRRHPFKRVDLLIELYALADEYKKLVRDVQTYEQDPSNQNVIPLRNRMRVYEKKASSLEYRLNNLRLYDRQDEEEADILGMRYAVTAGYSAEGLSDCLRKLEAATFQEFGTAVLEEDMSHPPISRRLEILRRVRASWQQ